MKQRESTWSLCVKKSREQGRLCACSCVPDLTSGCVIAKWHPVALDFIHWLLSAQPGRTELKLRRPCVVVDFSSWGRAITYPGRCPRSFFTFHLKSRQFLAFKGHIIPTFKIADSENLTDCLKMMLWLAQTYSICITAHTANTYITKASRLHIFAFYLFSFAISL